jgi:UDP-glucose 4-epimerase
LLELLGAGEDVLVLDILSTGHRWAVPDEARFVEGDIGDHNLVRRLLLRNPIDAIIHFAGSIVVPESVADPLGYYLQIPLADRRCSGTKSRISSSLRPPPSTACRR